VDNDGDEVVLTGFSIFHVGVNEPPTGKKTVLRVLGVFWAKTLVLGILGMCA
jgi:hypothetical protein